MTSFALSLVAFVAFFINPLSTNQTTRYEVGPGTRMRDYQYVSPTAAAPCTGSGTQPSCAHKPDTQNKWIGRIPLLADATGTGSATVKTTGPDGTSGGKYKAICVPNPMRKMGTGTGRTFFNTGTSSLLTLFYQNVRNPAAAAGDVGFVHSCGAGSGASILDNLSTVTGATVRFVPTSTNSIWNDKDFLALTMSIDPTPSFRAQLWYEVLGIGEKF